MSLQAVRRAICPKCGDENQYYNFWATWNCVFGDRIPPIKNKCSICGSSLSEKDAGEIIYGRDSRNIENVLNKMEKK